MLKVIRRLVILYYVQYIIYLNVRSVLFHFKYILIIYILHYS